MCLLLRNVISHNRLEFLLPRETHEHPNSPSVSTTSSTVSASLSSVVPEDHLDGSETEMDFWKLQSNQEKSQTPPEADGLVLQFLFIFSAHQERLADLLGGKGVCGSCVCDQYVSALETVCLAGWHSHGAKCHIFCPSVPGDALSGEFYQCN